MSRVGRRGAGRAWIARGALWLSLGVLAAGAGSGCRKAHVPGTPSNEAILDAFRDASLNVDAMKSAEADTWGADNCVAGSVSGLDVVVCEFATEQALTKSEGEAIRDWNVVNVDTGVVEHNGRTMLLIVDRSKKDFNGRAIARMLGAFHQVQ